MEPGNAWQEIRRGFFKIRDIPLRRGMRKLPLHKNMAKTEVEKIVTVVIVCDSALRFTTTHPYCARKAVFGYWGITRDQFMELPDEVVETFTAISQPLMALDNSGGNA